MTHFKAQFTAQSAALRAEADAATESSRAARAAYIKGMTDRVADDELRRLHHISMDAHAAAIKAHNKFLGVREVVYFS